MPAPYPAPYPAPSPFAGATYPAPGYQTEGVQGSAIGFTGSYSDKTGPNS